MLARRRGGALVCWSAVSEGGPEAPADRGPSRVDAGIGAALLGVGAAFVPVLSGVLGLAEPAGGDADLWGLYALNTPLGAPSAVPPAFPALVYLLHAATGLMPVPAAGLAAWIGAALVPPATYLLARGLGAGRALAIAAASLALLTPHTAALTTQAQPDTWVMLLLLCGALAVLAVRRWPGALGSSLLAVIAGTAPLWRSHGLVLAAVLLGLAPVLHGRLAWRGARVVAILGVLVLAPALFGQGAGTPWDQPWFTRVANAGAELRTSDVPVHARLEVPAEERDRIASYYHDGARFGLIRYHATRAIGGAPEAWALVVAALALTAVGGVGLRRLAPLAPLVAVLPALVVWSDPRHVAVALPVAFAAMAAGPVGRRRHARWAGLALAGILAVVAQRTWPAVADELRTQSAGNGYLADVGAEICERARPGDLAAGDLKAFLYCPMPFAPPGDPATDWRIWWVTRAPRTEAGWGRIHTDSPRFHVHRLHPEITGDDRPCHDSFAPASTPYITPHPQLVALAPPCEPDAAWVAGLPEAPAEIRSGPSEGEGNGPSAGPRAGEDRARRERARPGSRPRSGE